MHDPHRFTFVKPMKVGGTSMEIVLAHDVTGSAIVTTLSPGDEIDRYRRTKRSASSVFRDHLDAWRYPRAVRTLASCDDTPEGARCRGALATIKKIRKRVRIGSHAPLRRTLDFLSASEMSPAPLLSICRHPYELVVSQAHWNVRKNPSVTVEEAIDAIVAKPHANLRAYGLNDVARGSPHRFAFILRLEDLRRDLTHLAGVFDLDLPEALPCAKGNVRTDRRPAEAILSSSQKAAMERSNRALFDLWDRPPRP